MAVDGGECAVIFDRIYGVKQGVVGEGTHFLIPGLQKPIIFEVRTQAHEVSSHTGSRGETPLPIMAHVACFATMCVRESWQSF